MRAKKAQYDCVMTVIGQYRLSIIAKQSLEEGDSIWKKKKKQAQNQTKPKR